MSALLDAVREAADAREDAEHAFRAALREARAEHSLREIAHAAGLTAPGVRYLLMREESAR